jgi:hypothetical protein
MTFLLPLSGSICQSPSSSPLLERARRPFFSSFAGYLCTMVDSVVVDNVIMPLLTMLGSPRRRRRERLQPSEVRQRHRSPHHSGLLLRVPGSARHAPRSTPQPDWSPPPLELRAGIDSMEQRGRGAQGKLGTGRSQQVNSWGVRWTFRMPGPTYQCVLTVDF